jgi:uncharacterized protein YyaL (SSP411 family)
MHRRGAIDLGLEWLSSLSIRSDGRENALTGGVHHGYDWQRRAHTYAYSEITGYAMSAFVNAYRWTGEDRYLALARQAAGFLLRVQALAKEEPARGAILHSLSLPDGEPVREYHSFDAAMCLQGLLDLAHIDPSLDLQDSAQAIGEWLVLRMQRSDGSFLSMYDPAADEWHHRMEYFYDDGGCLHAKHAIGLLKLGRATGDERYISAAQRACDWVLCLQDGDGAFWAAEHLSHVVSHPHCYATEGLLYAYWILGTDRYRRSAERAGMWLLDVQNGDGSVNIEYKRKWWRMGRRVTEKLFPRRVTDATAQAMRIWLILYYLDGDVRWLEACQRGQRFLLQMQSVDTRDEKALGGFYFWPGHPVMYAWCAMFAVHALYALDHAERTEGYEHMMLELF